MGNQVSPIGKKRNRIFPGNRHRSCVELHFYCRMRHGFYHFQRFAGGGHEVCTVTFRIWLKAYLYALVVGYLPQLAEEGHAAITRFCPA